MLWNSTDWWEREGWFSDASFHQPKACCHPFWWYITIRFSNIASEHVIQTELRKLTPGYCCTHCTFIGVGKTVEDHVLRKHQDGTTLFECRKYGERFTQEEKARNHMRKKHASTKPDNCIHVNNAQRLLERYARPATYEKEQQLVSSRVLKKRKPDATSPDPPSAEPPKKAIKNLDSPILLFHAPIQDPVLATQQSIPLTPLSPDRSPVPKDPITPWTEFLTLHRQQLKQQHEKTPLLSTLLEEQKYIHNKLATKVEAQEMRLVNVAKDLSCTQGEVHQQGNQLVTVEEITTDSKKKPVRIFRRSWKWHQARSVLSPPSWPECSPEKQTPLRTHPRTSVCLGSFGRMA